MAKADAEDFVLTLSLVPLELAIEVIPAGAWFERSFAWGCQVGDSAYL